MRSYQSMRKFCNVARPKIPFDVPLPGVPQPMYKDIEKISYDTELTTLKNGLRVASQERYGQYCTIGVAIKSGSRFETGFPVGVSNIAEKIGFMSSKSYPNRDIILKELEKYGAICDSQTSRDTTVYAVSTERHGVGAIMKLLADVVLRPLITQDELNMARQAIGFELEDMEMKPEQEPILMEMIHAAAWGDSSLGNPRYCPKANLDVIGRDELLQFMKLHFTPDRIVVAGVGVDHKEMVDLANEHFNHETATWNIEGLKQVNPLGSDSSVAKYVGREIRIEKDFGAFNAGPLPVPNLAHIALGLESIPHSDKSFIPACVLNLMMGGGGSFSAGGPGKGMYSRLYTNVLNIHHWLYNATAYNNSYGDSGLFSIYASVPPAYLKNVVKVLVKEFGKMKGPMSDEEFNRAKTQLKSMLLMNLESRPVIFEDIGRQVLATGHYKTPMEYIELINAVEKEDILALSRQILSGPPCLAALGNLKNLPSFEEIQGMFRKL